MRKQPLKIVEVKERTSKDRLFEMAAKLTDAIGYPVYSELVHNSYAQVKDKPRLITEVEDQNTRKQPYLALTEIRPDTVIAELSGDEKHMLRLVNAAVQGTRDYSAVLLTPGSRNPHAWWMIAKIPGATCGKLEPELGDQRTLWNVPSYYYNMSDFSAPFSEEALEKLFSQKKLPLMMRGESDLDSRISEDGSTLHLTYSVRPHLRRTHLRANFAYQLPEGILGVTTQISNPASFKPIIDIADELTAQLAFSRHKLRETPFFFAQGEAAREGAERAVEKGWLKPIDSCKYFSSFNPIYQRTSQ